MLAVHPLKRARDSEGGGGQQGGATCPPHRWQLESPASKRTRQHAEAVAAASGSSAFAADDAGARSAPPELGSSSLRAQRIDPHTGEVLFSLDQVKDIVRRAVDEKERGLREQYDRILAQKLQEQYQAFAKFNEDYISRQAKGTDMNYVS